MALLGRILVIIFAVMVASFAAGMAIAMGLLGPEWHVLTGDPGERVVFWGAAFFGAAATGAIGLLPLVILIALAESLKIRSLFANALGGVALLLLGYYGSGLARPGYEESIDHPPPAISREAELAVAAGAVFGLVYWAVAGRKAGPLARKKRGMNRTGLLIALVIAAVTGLVFGLYPDLDLDVSRVFYFHMVGNNAFGWRLYPPLMTARDLGLWVGTALITPFLIALAIKLILPGRKLLVSGRAIIFLTATLVLGPGLLVNVMLKDHWHRPRPIDVQQFGGDEHFRAWWDPRGDCPNNCAFVSGDVAGAFWTIAPAVLAPPAWRAVAVGAALTLGAGMAVVRIMAGAHFASDVIFAGVFTFLVIWLMHGLIYRWPSTRTTDEKVERDIERLAGTRYRSKKQSAGGR